MRSLYTLINLHIHFEIRFAHLVTHVFCLDFRVKTQYTSIVFFVESKLLNGLLSLELVFGKR